MQKLLLTTGVSILISFSSMSQENRTRVGLVSEFVQEYLEMKYPNVVLDTFIYVGVERQELYLCINREVVKLYEVSTSKHGAGSQNGSNCTPTGLHCINGKFGEGVPKGGVLIGRKFTGKVADIEFSPVPTGHDDITSRVLTLAGLEDGVNKGGEIDTYRRQIYIHGTAEEGMIGKPASHGCIRMKNDDIIELFSIVNEGVTIVILDN